MMLSTRSPLKNKNENVSAKFGSMSLGDKENTVSKHPSTTIYCIIETCSSLLHEMFELLSNQKLRETSL